MKSYFGYIRVSTQRQGAHGSSLQEQKSAIEAYAARNGLSITRWFEERETAAKQGRRVFRKMLAELASDKVRGIIVHKIDRSARNLRDWADLNELIDRGVEIHFAHDALDLSSRGGRLSADIQAVVAADFIRNLREETRKGFYGRLKQGLYPLRAPIGYLDMGRGLLKEIDPQKAPLVRHAFELYATGVWNFEQLEQELFQQGLRNKNGGRVTKNGLTTILNNPFYIGLVHIRKTDEVFQGGHVALIPKPLYDRVQMVLRGARLDGGKRHEFLFSRTIRCASCGNHLIGERQKGRYVYYRCHRPAHACVSEKAVDSMLKENLALLTFAPEEVRDLRDLVGVERDDIDKRKSEREASLKLSIAATSDRLARLTDALIDGLIDKEAFEERKRRALEERCDLDAAIAELPNMVPLERYLNENVELANTAYLQYENGNLYFKRETLKKLKSNFVARGNSLVFAPPSPFKEILELRKSDDCDPHRDRTRTRMKKLFKLMKVICEKEEEQKKAARQEAAGDQRLAA